MSSEYLVLFIMLASSAAAAAVAAYVLAPNEDEAVLRLRAQEVRLYHRPPETVEEVELSKPLTQRIFEPWLARVYGILLSRTPQGMLNLTKSRLREAGSPMEVGTFLALRLLAGVLGVLLLGGFGLYGYVRGGGLGTVIVYAVVGGYAASTIPSFHLSRVAARRKRDISRTLPEVLDLLCISVEAGLGLDGAVQKVAERHNSPLAQELMYCQKEISLGVPREKAWRNLAERINLPDVNVVVAAIMQAEKLGTSIGQVLRIQANDARERRRLQTEERARQLPVKLLLPLVVFIFPSLFVVLMGPAVIQFMQSMR